MLDLINDERKRAGLQPVELDLELSGIAQLHAQDMVNRDYTGHVNPEGLTPTERAVRGGVQTTVGENIASNPNITDANFALARSPVHYENMLRPFWTRVGIGMAQYSSGLFKIVQLFSSRDFADEPLSASEKKSINQQLVEGILEVNPTLIGENERLSSALQSWHQSSPNSSISSFLRSRGFNGFTLRNLNVPFTPDIYEKIIERRVFKE